MPISHLSKKIAQNPEKKGQKVKTSQEQAKETKQAKTNKTRQISTSLNNFRQISSNFQQVETNLNKQNKQNCEKTRRKLEK